MSDETPNKPKKHKGGKAKHALASTDASSVKTTLHGIEEDPKKGSDSEDSKEPEQLNFEDRMIRAMENLERRMARMEKSQTKEPTRNLKGAFDETRTEEERKKRSRARQKRKDKHRKVAEQCTLLERVAQSARKPTVKKISKSREKSRDGDRNSRSGGDGDDGDGDDDDSDDSSGSRSGSMRSRSDYYTEGESEEEDGDRDMKTTSTLFRGLNNSQLNAAKQHITVTRVEKECKVYIDNCELATVCKAIKDIQIFQDRENTAVNLLKIMSTKVVTHLCLKNGIQKGDLYGATLEEVFHLMIQESKVYSSKAFNEELKKALSHVKLMPWEEVNASNHEKYYYQQLQLCDEYMLTLRIMLKENKAVCPAVSTRDMGLLVFFRSLHSRAYWDYISPFFKHHKTMQSFIDDYKEKALEQFTLSQATREIPYASNKAAYQSKSYEEKKNHYHSTSRKLGTYVNNKYGKREDNFKKGYLNHLDAEHGYSSADSQGSAETWRDANPRDKEDDNRELEDSGHELEEPM